MKGDEAELRSVSDEFGGHCLALTLLGSYLTDAYNGDIRRRREFSEHLAHDVRQRVHARSVTESYQTWFGEGLELSVLRILGLFDRPAEKKAIGALLRTPAIPELTESITGLSQREWQTIIAKLRRGRLLAEESAGGVPNCTASATYFSQLLVDRAIVLKILWGPGVKTALDPDCSESLQGPLDRYCQPAGSGLWRPRVIRL